MPPSQNTAKACGFECIYKLNCKRSFKFQLVYGEMKKGVLFSTTFLFCCLVLLLDCAVSLPLCVDSRAPFTLNKTLGFCPYNGSTCCNSTQDAQIQKQFQAMKVSDPACASVLKSILCARCDPFSAELYTVQSSPRSVPVLCNSTVPANSSQSKAAAVEDFCSQVWDTCQTVYITNSPFAPSLQGQARGPQIKANATKLTNLWQSKTDFCSAFGGTSTNTSVCFEGEPVALNKTTTPINPPLGLCLEKIGNGSYLSMAAHPDGSNRAFFSNQMGKVWLATLPDKESGGTLKLDESSPFVDLTDQVYFNTLFGMMGMAFHPNFAQNGRFFASFNCDKSKWSGCNGRCACNSDVNCDPSKIGTDHGSAPCQYQTVIAEYTANGTGSQPSSAESAKPTEVRRIFTMGLPYTSHHGGQILFGPEDGYLYFMMGDGGGSGDPNNFSQNKKSLLGKIMRIDVDNIPSAAEISKLGLWGNYSIPKDNPFSEDKDLQPEIWALGLRNPWRCSFDSERPSYFVCADVGQDLYEEVDLITKGGNYGWSVYEGPYLFNPTQSVGGNTSVKSINSIFPILGYNHSVVNKNEGSASITGGYVYRSTTDPCTYGRYLYGDLYAGAIWAATEDPENSGNFSTNKTPFKCAHDSAIKCDSAPGSSLPALGYIFSFGEDNNKDVYILASAGVYRVVRPSRCSYACSLEKTTATNPTSQPPGPSPSLAIRWSNVSGYLMLLQFSSILLILLTLL
ncbi:HIPL1 protein [Arachis duranensis]|uniref:HIPL1 protein n=1 Tax=Arachis duranensis TaxID=130453 RepID=A0A6P4DFZ6_ARADU|nr:HIPL1 protein [Arachis duranensis]